MKKIFIAPIGIALLLALSGIVVAEAPISGVKKEIREERTEFRANVVAPIKKEIKDLRATKSASSTELRKEIKDAKEEIKEKRKEFRTEIKKKLELAAKARLDKNLDKMKEAVSRLTDINTRIETRIAKLQTAGNNMATATAALIIAKEKATLAGLAIDTAKTNIDSAVLASTTDINFLKEYMKTAEEALKTARKATEVAISTLKGLGKPEKPTEASKED